MRKGKRTVIPGVLNKLSCWSVRLVPRRFASWMSARVLGKPRAGDLPSRTGVA
jgi:short-subunit dehydrogenase